MIQGTKPAVASVTIWGGLIAILPTIYESLPDIINQVLPVLSPHTALLVQAVGGLIAIAGRIASSGKLISGVVKTPEE